MMNMEQWIVAGAGVVTAVVIPFVVNLCTTDKCSAETKRIVALAFSLLGGVATAFLAGMPTPETLVMWVFAVIGGVQTAYTAFKAIGVTNGWLDALTSVGNTPKE